MDRGTGNAFRRGDDIQLTHHFKLSEFTKSETAQSEGIDNTPSAEEVAHLRDLAFSLLEPIRDYVKEPVYISSGFRSDELNARVGGCLQLPTHTRQGSRHLLPEWEAEECV